MLRLRTIVIIVLNLLLVAVTGAYGYAHDEPYWRANGHSPELYDYLFSCALALNGPSGFIAAILPQFFVPQNALEREFIAQYELWLLFIPVQWWCYERAVVWGLASRVRKIVLSWIAGVVATAGFAIACYAWLYAPLDADCSNSAAIYGAIMLFIALALPGSVFLAYSQFAAPAGTRHSAAANARPSAFRIEP